MTHEQFQSVCTQILHKIDEHMLALDLYAEPTLVELQEFADNVRRNLGAYRAAKVSYYEGPQNPIQRIADMDQRLDHIERQLAHHPKVDPDFAANYARKLIDRSQGNFTESPGRP